MHIRTTVVVAAAAAALSGVSLPPQAAGVITDGTSNPHWDERPTGTNEQYRGLDAVSKRVVWVSGEEGGVLRTTDKGQTWRDVAPPGTSKLAFRDVEATSRRHASVLSIGTGTDSRIYTTEDAGKTWTLAFVNRAPNAFYDCMAFWGEGKHGLAVSDPVNGKFRIIRTRDFGTSWRVLSDRGMPRAKDGEFAFAASGTCLVAEGSSRAWLGSGGGASRVFRTRDRGLTWKVSPSRIPAAAAGGVFSLAFRNARTGMAVGGDFTKPRKEDDTASRTRNHGSGWQRVADVHGYRSGVDFVAKRHGTWVAVGPTGSDITRNAGNSWLRFSRTPYDAVSCTDQGVCWASGPEGAVARLRFGRH
ncbi:MAG: oxidoreductase [Nocardioidaceae bacterium]|nr:oxidoreductase [Nocardioidaceae bacterium]